METIHYNDLVSRFTKTPIASLKFLTPIDQIQSLISTQSQEPQNLKNTFFDPNDIYLATKTHENKKKTSTKQFIKKASQKQHKKQQKQQHLQHHATTQQQQRKKVYKPGPFALFYQINQNKLQKDQQVWYYKSHKDIIGPVSSYNMDKMAYYKNVEDQTRVAYKSVEKFVKFSKIKKIVEENKKTEEQLTNLNLQE